MPDEMDAPTTGLTEPNPSTDLGPILGKVLGLGSALSTLLIAAGLIVALLQGYRGGAGMRPDVLLHSLEHGQGVGIISLGIAVLVATPIVREATAFRFFVRSKDTSFAAMTAIVLLLVAFSMFVGAR